MINTTEISFRESDHSYWKGAIRIPGISELLKYWGYMDGSYYSEIPRDRGIAVHALIEDHCRGGSAIMGNDDPEIVGRIESFLEFKAAKDFRPQQIEAIHFSAIANLACRIDLVGTFRDSPTPCIVEIKCGSRAGWHGLQTAAQALCLGVRPIRRFALYLRANGKPDLREHNESAEIPLVQSLAALYHYNQKCGIKLIQGGL